jgi:hypothetical protein
MTGKKVKELKDAELDQVTGGAADSHDAYANLEVSHLKSNLSKSKTVRGAKAIAAQNGSGSI